MTGTEKLCREWNERFPIGTSVKYDGHKTRTASAAFVREGKAIIYLLGIAECPEIEKVQPRGRFIA